MADENLNNALNSINQAGGAAQQLAEMLQAASRSSSRQTTATDVARDSMREFDRAQNNVRSGMLGMVNTLSSLAGSLVSVASSAYTADKAFTAVIPTLDAMGAALKGTFDALGKAGSGASIFGFSMGQASEGVAAAAKLYVDVIQGALRFQLEAAQSMADRFIELSQTGAVFGGGLTEIRAVMHGTTQTLADGTTKFTKGIGLPIQEFTKIVTQNLESINALGLGTRRGATQIAGMGKQIFNTSSSLVALYGSVSELAKGAGEYMALQAQTGVNVARDFERLEEPTKEYLMRQKELSAITGKSAETLRSEEQERRKQLDYNLKAGRLGADAQENLREAMGVAGKFGPMAAEYAREYFATGGKVVNKELLAYAATNVEAAQAVEQMVNGIQLSRDQFRTELGKTAKEAAVAISANNETYEDLASVARASGNRVLQSQVDTQMAVRQNLASFENMAELFKQLASEREKLKDLDQPLQAFVTANKAMLESRKEIDDLTLANMSKMEDLVKVLYETQMGFIKSMPDAVKAFNDLKQAGTDTNAILKEFGERLARLMGFNASSVAPPPAAANTATTQQYDQLGNPISNPADVGPALRPNQIPNLRPGDVAPQVSPFSGRNPQLQPEADTRTPLNTDRRSQAEDNKPIVQALGNLPTKSDAERMNRDVLDALNKLTNVMA